jgi:hypothetical protein
MVPIGILLLSSPGHIIDRTLHLNQTFFGCLTTDAFSGFCLLICLTDSNELFFVVILVLSCLLVSLVPY